MKNSHILISALIGAAFGFMVSKIVYSNNFTNNNVLKREDIISQIKYILKLQGRPEWVASDEKALSRTDLLNILQTVISEGNTSAIKK